MGKKVFLVLGLFLAGLLGQISIAADEDYWLHVDGKDIKNAKGEIFVGAGVAYNCNNKAVSPDEVILNWCKEHGVNIIRLSIHSVMKIDDMDKFVSEFVDPFIQSCKDFGVYVFLDQHEYMHEYLPDDDWLPDGKLWNEERIQTWIDHWVKLANKYKDEPWVMGYELVNEPKDISAKKTSEFYVRCIKAIREIDKKHIILLGNCNFTHAKNMEETWGPINFKPDEPYNQVVFSFHEYTHADDPGKVAPILDKIQQKYNVPIYCTEFGADDTLTGIKLPVEEKREFEKKMFEMFKSRKIGWALWGEEGVCPPSDIHYEDIWVPAAKEQGTPSPLQLLGKVDSTVSVDTVIADGTSAATITAAIKDNTGKVIATADNLVTFSIKAGEGKLDGANPIQAVKGVATIKIKSNSLGMCRISAKAKGYIPGNMAEVYFKSGKAVKVLCSADKTTVTAKIADGNGNQAEYGSVYRINCGGPQYIDKQGNLWLEDKPYAKGSFGFVNQLKKATPRENPIKGTDNPALFQTARQGDAGFGYKFDVPNGTYRVELCFAETYYGVQEGGKGSRVYDVAIENELKLDDYDIFAKTGSNAADKNVYTVQVNDGVLDITVPEVKADSARFNAISVTAENPAVKPAEFTFSVTEPGKLAGMNPVVPVAGVAVINVEAVSKVTVTAAYPGLISGSVDIDFSKK